MIKADLRCYKVITNIIECCLSQENIPIAPQRKYFGNLLWGYFSDVFETSPRQVAVAIADTASARLGPDSIRTRRLLENAHLLRYLKFFVTAAYRKYASFLRISDALHLDIFQQPPKKGFSDRLLDVGIGLFTCMLTKGSHSRSCAGSNAFAYAVARGGVADMALLLDIKNITEEDLGRQLEGYHVPPYRAGQILRWIYYRQVSDFEKMTDLSKDLRKRLSERFSISRLEPQQVAVSGDGSRKYLFRLEDGQTVETVLIPERGHSTLCVSSQVGCAMGCRFCLTGRGGFIRNLEPAEIINQVCAVKEDLGADKDSLTNIVLMGMGEPLANYDNIILALKTMMNNNGLQFSSRRVTLSTVGLAPRMNDLGRDVIVNLAVSLNAADNATRDKIMPINRTYPIEVLLEACRRFPLPSRRMITFEYVMIAGINDCAEDARNLIKLLRPLRAKINLIPLNPFEGSLFQRPEEDVVLAFQKILTDQNFTAMIRWSKGQDIGAACGQLRARQASPS